MIINDIALQFNIINNYFIIILIHDGILTLNLIILGYLFGEVAIQLTFFKWCQLFIFLKLIDFFFN